MKCALCENSDKFPRSGSYDGRPIFRCPRCKYDQTKGFPGVGQFIGKRASSLRLDKPAEPSWTKLMFYSRMGKRLPPDLLEQSHPRELFPFPNDEHELAELVRQHLMAQGLDAEMAAMMFDSPPDWLLADLSEVQELLKMNE